MKAVVCPVCNGRGLVPAGFYRVDNYTTTSKMPETCQSCGGSGVLYVPEGQRGKE